MIDIASKYRLKALACEKNAKDTTEPALKQGWGEIAIEWHALSNRVLAYSRN